MLGRLEMNTDECIAEYCALMKTIFKEQASSLPFSWRGKVKTRFDSTKLKRAVEEMINRAGASPTDAFNDGRSSRCRT
jgi:hypothetical protein